VAARKCTECPNTLDEGSRAKTCSQKCRTKRSRRIRRSRVAGGEANALPEHLQPLNAAANKRGGTDLLHEVAKEELRPVVRDAITQEVLEAAGQLVGLTPLMVTAIEMDLKSPDAMIRQKAYSVLARYTLGNASIAPTMEAAPPAVSVVFALPRPGDVAVMADGAEVEIPEVTEVLVCVECEAEKPSGEFIEGSHRCRSCHEGLHAQVAERFSKSDR
jgi:hypothetical protein